MHRDVFIKRLFVTGLHVIVFSLSVLLTGCGDSYHPFRVSSESMLPLIRPGDRILVDVGDQSRSNLHDGEVVALRREDAIVLKRIMAMPGETISGDQRKVFRNGKQVDEPYLAPATPEDGPALTTFPVRTVAAGELFVMGDNRDRSFDSRATEYGPVRFSDVVGEYRWTYWHAQTDTKQK